MSEQLYRWVKASERLPEIPGQHLFRVIGKDGSDDNAYFVKFVTKADLANHLKIVNDPKAHEWLESIDIDKVVEQLRGANPYRHLSPSKRSEGFDEACDKLKELLNQKEGK